MDIPSFFDGKFVEKDGNLTGNFKLFFEQLITELQGKAGQEGIVAPTVSSANSSVTPPNVGGQIAQITPNAQAGTVIYNSGTNHLMVALQI